MVYGVKMGLNSGYIGIDKRTTKAGVISSQKHYLQRIGGSFSSALFTPTNQSGLLLWMDSSNLGLANNDAVNAWNPRGGDSAQSANIVGSPSPTYKTAVLNGLGVVEFVAGEGRVRGVLTDTGTTYTIVALARLTTGSANRVFSGVYMPRNWLLGWHASKSVLTGYAGAFLDPGGSANDTNWRIISFTQSGSSGILYEFGVSTGSSSGLTDRLGDKFAFSGYDASGTLETTSCQIAEFIVYNSALVTLDRQVIEGYVAWKWGLNSSLSVSHPYYGGPP